MTIRTALAAALLAALLAAGPFAALAHGPKPEDGKPHAYIEAEPVAGAVTMLIGADGFTGGNVAVSAGPDGLLIVDDKIPDFSAKLNRKLAKLATCSTCGDLKFVLNTHWHPDHTGGNAFFGGGAVIVAHENVRKRMSSDQEVKIFGMKIPAAPKSALPVVTFGTAISIHFNGEEIQLASYASGHTDTDTLVYFSGSKVLHAGDLVFARMFPFVDFENGGTVEGMIRNVEALIDTYPADTKVIPGHGPLTDMQGVKDFLAMLKATSKIVGDGIKAGKSLEQLQKAGLPEEWKSWEWPFIDTAMWIKILHGSLTK